MNIETNNAAGLILQRSDYAGVKTSKADTGNKSFQDELKTNSKEEVETDKDKIDEKEEVKSKSDDKKVEQKHVKSNQQAENNKSAEENCNQGYDGQGQGQGQNQQGELSASDIQNIQTGNISYLSDEVMAYLNANGGLTMLNQVDLMNTKNIADLQGISASIDYKSIEMSDGDALFFAQLVKNTDMSGQSIAGEFQKALMEGNVQQVASTAKASAALIAALQESAKNNQPFRIDFDKDISVIIKVDREGKINANFIPGDEAVESYLRNNIDFLKNAFDRENIAYGDLGYSKSRQNKDEKENKNNKENSHE